MQDTSQLSVLLVSSLTTSVIAPIVGYVLGDLRMRRQRRWDAEDRDRIAQQTQSSIAAVHADVVDAKHQASAAYHEANGVNRWRAEFTRDMSEQNAKVMEQLKRPAQPPLIILPPSPDKECDASDGTS